MVRVTIWNENRHEQSNEHVQKLYPKGIHGAIADLLAQDEAIVTQTATLDEPEHGLSEEVLDNTDVLFGGVIAPTGKFKMKLSTESNSAYSAVWDWWCCHSGHYAKIFKRLMGTNCSFKWREEAERERLWNVAPGHPLTQGIGEQIVLENAEMYGERFDIPEPDESIFISWFEGGEVFRSGCVWRRGHGTIFYFRPGHETYPIYYNQEIGQVLRNAAHYCQARVSISTRKSPHIAASFEELSEKDLSFGKAGIEGQE